MELATEASLHCTFGQQWIIKGNLLLSWWFIFLIGSYCMLVANTCMQGKSGHASWVRFCFVRY